MLGVLQVASYISMRYMDIFGTRIDEMKLHKLLYFTQRECLIQMREPMFGHILKLGNMGLSWCLFASITKMILFTNLYLPNNLHYIRMFLIWCLRLMLLKNHGA